MTVNTEPITDLLGVAIVGGLALKTLDMMDNSLNKPKNKTKKTKEKNNPEFGFGFLK